MPRLAGQQGTTETLNEEVEIEEAAQIEITWRSVTKLQGVLNL